MKLGASVLCCEPQGARRASDRIPSCFVAVLRG